MTRTYRLVRLVFTLLLVSGLTGCSGAQQTRSLLDRRPAHLPDAAEIAAVPFFPQTQHQCGPAALATVLVHYGINTTPGRLSPQVYVPGREGSLQVEMTSAARRHGMLPYPLKPSMDHLLSEVAAGHPVLILQNNGFDWLPQWHYAVVIGYDFDLRQFSLRSGEIKARQTSFATFERTWSRAGYWALVILPAGRVPVTSELPVYLKAAYGLEETGFGESALEAYRAATGAWPAESRAWLALGNMAYGLGELEEAVAAFMHAAGIEPGDALIWNNLAYALQSQGCSEHARRAIDCARRLEPDDANIRDSAREIRLRTEVATAGVCPEFSC